MTDERDRGGRLLWLAPALVGVAAGLGLYVTSYAEATSYLRDDPSACANCHVMQGHFDAWVKSSHGKFAGCNDCHAPHDGVVAKYVSKARNGFFHSLAFTTGNHPENLRITEYNRGIAQDACRACHAGLVQDIEPAVAAHGGGDSLDCIRCHSTVGHDR